MALRQGMALAKSLNARVTALTVSPPFHAIAMEPGLVTEMREDFERKRGAAAERYLTLARDTAKIVGVACETVHVIHDHPYQAIIDTAANAGCDLVFMASHGRRGVSALLLGSETTKVLTHSKIPVLVWR
jgi:nucleotide-binding universal stress UspA family protein